MSPKSVLEKLIDMALFDRYLSGCPSARNPKSPKAKVGYLLTRLSPKEREVLAGLSCKDTLNFRIEFVE